MINVEQGAENMKMIRVVWIPVTALLFSMVCSAETNAPAEKLWSAKQTAEVVASESRGHALSSMAVLAALRHGKIEAALETLEFELDASAVTSWCLFQRGTAAQKATEMQFLKTIKEYRDKHPRKQEAKIGDGEFQKTLEKTTAEAEKILKDLN